MATAQEKQLEAFKVRARDIAERWLENATAYGALSRSTEYSNEMYHLCKLAQEVLGARDDKEASDE